MDINRGSGSALLSLVDFHRILLSNKLYNHTIQSKVISPKYTIQIMMVFSALKTAQQSVCIIDTKVFRSIAECDHTLFGYILQHSTVQYSTVEMYHTIR